MRRIRFIAAIFAVLMLGTSTALAAVTFDSITGTGFVGKGDVQFAFGWNNAQLQNNATGVTFSYVSNESWTAVCTFTTGEGTNGEQIHNVPRTKASAINGAVDGDPRAKKGQKQFTGYNLMGYIGEPTITGDPLPEVGDPCRGGGPEGGTYTSVELDEAASSGGLYATFNGITRAL